MERNLKIIKKSLILLGFDIEKKFIENPLISNALKCLRLVTLVAVISTITQSFVFFYVSLLDDPNKWRALTSMLYSTNSLLVFFSMFKNIDDMMELIRSIESCYKLKFKDNIRGHGGKFAEKFGKVGASVCGTFFAIPILKIFEGTVRMLISLYTGIRPQGLFLSILYWPFDPYDYLPWTFYYDMLKLFFAMAPALLGNQLMVSTTVFLSMCFEELAYEVKDVINGSRNRSFLDTKRKLRNSVQIHQQLIEFSKELNSLYGMSMLYIFMQASSLVGIYVFFAVVSLLIY